MSEGVLSTVDLDVVEVLATPVKGVAGQVMNLPVVSFPNYFPGPQLISFLFGHPMLSLTLPILYFCIIFGHIKTC